MLTNNTEPNWKVGITALFAMVVVVAGGLSLFNKSNDNTEPHTAVAADCSKFEAEAHKLFDQGDTVTLSGTFAPGDHVHLAIDFYGVGYSWESTGVLGKMPDVTSSGWFNWYTYTANSKATFTSTHTLVSSVSRGKISGFARLEVELDVTTAGDGTITINTANSMPSLRSPKVVIASCNASKQTPPITRQLSS
jgi:hypothetical protein